MQQTSFDFPFLDHYLSEEFLVSKENIKAFKFISQYQEKKPNLPDIFSIYGQKCCGKTHLAYIWQRITNAEFLNLNNFEDSVIANIIEKKHYYIIEDIDKIENQTALFHIFNIIIEKQSFLMVTSNLALNQIEYQFQDLKSRLQNIFSIKIDNPEADFIRQLLIKKFADRQLIVENKAIDYLAKNIDRNYSSIAKIAKLLEFYCFEEKRKITIPFIKNILSNLSQ